MAGPACGAEPPHWLNGGEGGGSEKRARLIGLSQYNRLPQHIEMRRFMKKKTKGMGRTPHLTTAFDVLEAPFVAQILVISVCVLLANYLPSFV